MTGPPTANPSEQPVDLQSSRSAPAPDLPADEQLYRVLFEHAREAIAFVDEHGTVLRVNRAWESETGVPREQIQGRHRTEFTGLSAEGRRTVEAEYSHALSTGGAIAEPLAIQRADGATVYVETSRTLVHIDGRRYFISVSRDVTARRELEERIRLSELRRTEDLVVQNEALAREIAERMNAEAALRKSEARFRPLIESGLLGMVSGSIDDARIVDANPTFLDMLGFTRDELLAMRWTELVAPEWQHVNARVVKELRALGRTSPWEKEYLRKDGSRVPVFGWTTTLPDGPGICMVFVLDRTELKQAEHAVLRLSEQRAADARFRALLEAAPDAMIVTDSRGHIVFVNAQAEQLFGYERAGLVGQPADMLLARRFQSSHPAQYFQPGAARELAGQRADGSELPVEITVSPLQTAEGLLISSAFRDITDRCTQRRLRDYQAQLQQMAFDAVVVEERARRHLACVLHDGLGQLLALMQIKLASLRSELPGAGRETVDEVVTLLAQAIGDCRGLVSDLSPPMLYELGISAALSWLAEEVEKRHGLRVQVRDDGAEKLLEDVTASIVFRSVRELLMNVVKHAGCSNAILSISATGSGLEIVLADRGVGFDPDSITPGRPGGGFGLMSVREQISRLGGALSVVSKPGLGTSTQLFVPLRQRTAGVPAATISGDSPLMAASVHTRAGHGIFAQHDSLAAAWFERALCRQPQLFEVRGQPDRAQSIKEASHLLQCLAQALVLNRHAMFLEYCAWARVFVFFHRSWSTEDLLLHLSGLIDLLHERLPKDLSAEAAAVVSAAMHAARALPEDAPTCLQGGHPLAPLARRYLERLLQSDRQAARQLVLDAVGAGTSVSDVYLHVFEPALQELGRLWQTNRITVAHEHAALATTQHIMSQLQPFFVCSPAAGRTLVAASVAGDTHDLGLRMVTEFFEMTGWRTLFLGADVPIASIVAALEEQHAGVLAISATLPGQLRAVSHLIDSIRATAAVSGVKVLVGGRAFNQDPELWRQIGADGWAPNAERAVQLANELVGVERAP